MSEEKIKEFLKYKIGLQIRFNQKYEEIFESLFSELCDFSRRNMIEPEISPSTTR